MSLLRALVVVVILASLGACHDGKKDDEPDYTPIADDRLFQQIGDLPGVTDVSVKWSDDFGNTGYIGRVTVDESADPVDTLDRAYAILRQGRYDAPIAVTVVQDGRMTSAAALGIGSSAAELTERYGPQPGTGEPPG